MPRSRHCACLAFVLACLCLPGLSNPVLAAEFAAHYAAGDAIDDGIFVTDREGSQVHLKSLLGEAEAGINVLFIFGGGDLGAGMPGHLWCPDSFEDTAILRTLYGKYQDKGVNFIAVASAPVYHSQVLGKKAGVFLTDADDSPDYRQAHDAFIDSTLAAVDSGILPFTPYFDSRYRLMFNRSPELAPREEYGEVFSWQGVFRAPTETQFYGVPSFWLLDGEGRIIAAPFRGNIYHPHGADVTINYTFRDIDAVLEGLLAAP